MDIELFSTFFCILFYSSLNSVQEVSVRFCFVSSYFIFYLLFSTFSAFCVVSVEILWRLFLFFFFVVKWPYTKITWQILTTHNETKKKNVGWTISTTNENLPLHFMVVELTKMIYFVTNVYFSYFRLNYSILCLENLPWNGWTLKEHTGLTFSPRRDYKRSMKKTWWE